MYSVVVLLAMLGFGFLVLSGVTIMLYEVIIPLWWRVKRKAKLDED
jgi:hypothetical protein